MADQQDPPSAAIENKAKPADGNAAESAPSGGRTENHGPNKNHSNKRPRMGDKRDKGRAEYERRGATSTDYVDRKRRKITKSGDVIELPPRENPFTQEEIAAEEKRPKRKVAVMVGYSGTGYKGMQYNNDEPTIERDLFLAFVKAGAISKANANDPRKSSLVRCARTDKGVHAAGNIISLKLIIEDEDIVQKINDALPEQIRIWGIQRTNNSFSCYQGCDSRWYEYLMPSYTLLPPHPQSYLGKMIPEYAKEKGYEDQLNEAMSDVKDFWATVDERDVRPILDGLDPETKAQVLERIHIEEDPSSTAAEGGNNKTNGEAEDDAEGKVMEPQTGISLETFQPKKRQLGPLDFALRDIKAAYVAAKRRYRVSPERLERLQQVLNQYQGTHNFHNYTVQKPFKDPSAKRHIKSFVVNKNPIIINDTEWLSLKVHGQSFMMHQIRKMVGLASLLVRCGSPLERVKESYQQQKMAIPKAPGLGLLLERPVFDAYNRKATEVLDRETIDFGKYEEELQAFKQKHIYNRIFDVEEKENAFHTFFGQIDSFKQNHFLWVTAGGLEVAKIANAKDQVEVDKELGDEDEDPEGGEG